MGLCMCSESTRCQFKKKDGGRFMKRRTRVEDIVVQRQQIRRGLKEIVIPGQTAFDQLSVRSSDQRVQTRKLGEGEARLT